MEESDGLEYRRRYRGLIGVIPTSPARPPPSSPSSTPPASRKPVSRSGRPSLFLRSDLPRQYGRIHHRRLRPLRPPRMGRPNLPSRSTKAKAFCLKTFAGIDAFPLCLATRDPDRDCRSRTAMAPTFGAICIDDISTPRTFTIADHLERATDIAGLFEPASRHRHSRARRAHQRAQGREQGDSPTSALSSVARASPGSASPACSSAPVRKTSAVCDRAGAIYIYRPGADELGEVVCRQGDESRTAATAHLSEMLKDADVFIGALHRRHRHRRDIAAMAPDAIVFALSIPTPEVDPAAARAAGARVVATGRSDYANTMDISLVFPGVFRGCSIAARTTSACARWSPPPMRWLAWSSRTSSMPTTSCPISSISGLRQTWPRPSSARPSTPVRLSASSLPKTSPNRPYATSMRDGAAHSPSTPPNNTGPSSESIELRRRHGGVLEVQSKIPIRDHHILESDLRAPGRTRTRRGHPRRSRPGYRADLQGQSGRHCHRRLCRAWTRRYRPTGRASGHGRQSRSLPLTGRGRSLSDLSRRARPRRYRRPCPRDRPKLWWRSTWKTSPPPAASRSNVACALSWKCPSFMTTSMAPQSSSARRCSTPPSCVERRSTNSTSPSTAAARPA